MKRKIYKLLSSTKQGLFALALTVFSGTANSQTTYTFNYTGAVQTINLQAGPYQIECWGANGGDATNSAAPMFGGKGGYSTGTYTNLTTATFNIYVGGRGGNTTAANTGGGGGGMSDIAAASNTNIIIIAAGGGGGATSGGASEASTGGDGGGLVGGTAIDGTGVSTGTAASGGSQTAGGIAQAGSYGAGTPGGYGYGGGAANGGADGVMHGAGGNGGNGGTGGWNGGGGGCTTTGGNDHAAGGGAGYYGGGGGRGDGGAGGGGSSYIGGVSNGVTIMFGQTGFVANPDVTGNGYVIITQLATPCTASIETPTITGSASGNSICLHAGETENLGVIYGSNAYIGVNYNWLASSSPSGPFSPVGTTTGPGFTTPGMGATAVYYMVEATCVSAGVTVASGVFGVLPNPTIALSSVPAINFTLSSLSVCTNDHYTVTASGAATYNWDNGASPATNVNPYILTPVAAFPDYTVTGISAEGCTDTNTMTIATILDAPIIFLNATANNICEGSNVILTVTGNSYIFSWAPNISGSGPIITVVPTSSTEYTVTAAAANGCSQTATQMITVNPPPVISVITSTTPGQVPCAKEAINMAASGAITYTWMSSDIYAQGSTIVVNPKKSSTYYVSGTDQNGCTGTTNFNLVVDACVGITELNANEGVNVYPNPNNGEFVVELNDGSAKSIELYDLTGRMVLSNMASDNKVNVNVNHLSNGVYYLKVKSDNATKMVKVVKQ